jgi:diguanylate cyclase (GGDEF)-like protein
MFNYECDKKKRIGDMLSVVKLCSLLFAGAVIFQHMFNFIYNINSTKRGYFYASIVTISILILSLIYLIWVFSTIRKSKSKYYKQLNLIESIVFIVLFFITILVSGAFESPYKLIFLFIIITSTIQHEMKQGIIIAGVSSVIILAIDIIYLPNQIVNSYFQNDLMLSAIFFLTSWLLGYYVKSEKEHIESLKKQVNEDGLTGIFNHRYFQEILRKTIMNSEKSNEPVSLIFIDIDYFKHYNDLYGHQKGDEVLKKIGTLLKECIRDGDVAARYGGEEFAIILPNTEEEDAVMIAEKIRIHIQDTYFEGEENQPNGKITASIGISTYPDKAKNDIDLLKSADDALYRAKFFNKNRTETYTSILDELKKDINEDDIEIATSIKTLISVINVKDRYTYGHVERVVIYCRLLADKLQMCEEEKKKLIYGAYMHDIGKINISKDILNKRMPLTNEEWELLKQHPANGVEILKPVESLKAVAPMIMHHHERYDGKGYPGNLRGKQIPYLARVLTVADSFDAMTSNRPYNKRKTYEEAIEELKKCSGTQFDPDIAKAFIEIIAENNKELDEISMA